MWYIEPEFAGNGLKRVAKQFFLGEKSTTCKDLSAISMPFEIIHILNIQFNGQCDLTFFFSWHGARIPGKKEYGLQMQNSAAFVYSIELFFIGGDLGVHNQCTMADGENVYYRGEGICNLVLATEKVIILFFNE